MNLQDSQKQQLLQELTDKLIQNADLKTKGWFDNYLKGAIEYRGLKTPQVTALVKDWYGANQLKNYPVSEQLALCCELISSQFAEDKFAGTIYLQKYLLKKLDYPELLASGNLLFQAGYFFDWSTTDWFCTRILDPTIIKYGIPAAEIIASWRYANNFWQRRAAIVSFRHASRYEEYHDLIMQMIADLVKEDRRFIQTGIGWVLADMSKTYPDKVEALFREHLQHLDHEVIDRHAKHLTCHRELKQLKRKLFPV